jgi:hypothetical protein
MDTGPPNDELQRTSDGNAAGSPLNSVFDGRNARTEWHSVTAALIEAAARR